MGKDECPRKLSRDKKIGFSFSFFWGETHYELRKGKASGLVAITWAFVLLSAKPELLLLNKNDFTDKANL